MLNSDVIIVAVIFFSIVAVIKMFLDNSMRRKLIDKDKLDENVKYLFSSYSGRKNSFKWGLVLIGVGAALLIGQAVGFQEEGILGLMFLLAGAAMVLFYLFVDRLPDDQQG
jgi:hypothetical protein